MPKTKTSVLNKRSLTDKGAFAFYRKNQKHRKMGDISSIYDHKKIVNAFYTKVAEKMVEKRGGVFIPSFGYFVVLLDPIKKLFRPRYIKETKKHYVNSHTDSRVYHPAFLGVSREIGMRYFVMDRAFNRNLTHKLSINLKNGKKYSNHFGLLLSIFKTKKR